MVFSDKRDSSHDLGVSGFTCLGTITNPRMFCKVLMVYV